MCLWCFLYSITNCFCFGVTFDWFYSVWAPLPALPADKTPSEIFTPQCNLVDFGLCHSFFYLFLLKGAGNTKLCGNPVRALRARREKLRVGGRFENKTPRKELETDSATFKKKIIILCSNVKGTMGNATGSFILAEIQHWCYLYSVLFFQPPL